jgi:hypothetical protein
MLLQGNEFMAWVVAAACRCIGGPRGGRGTLLPGYAGARGASEGRIRGGGAAPVAAPRLRVQQWQPQVAGVYTETGRWGPRAAEWT